MILRYENGLEDAVQFNRYHLMHSPTFKRNRIKCLAALFVLFVGGSLILPLAEDPPPSLRIAIGIASAVAASLWVILMGPASMDRTVRRLFREGNNKNNFCQHELEIDERGICERAELHETLLYWRGVERIIGTESYVFIYVSSVAAHIIPRNAITAGDLERFVATAREYWRTANPEAAT